MKNKLVVFLIAAIALLVLPLLAQHVGNFWVRMLDFALLYVLLALGLNIVVGYAGLLDLGYVAFYAVGAYMFGLLASPHLGENFAAIKAIFPQGLHTPFWVVIPLGAALAGMAATLQPRLAIPLLDNVLLGAQAVVDAALRPPSALAPPDAPRIAVKGLSAALTRLLV